MRQILLLRCRIYRDPVSFMPREIFIITLHASNSREVHLVKKQELWSPHGHEIFQHVKFRRLGSYQFRMDRWQP
jgi:hypothetical protein